jgi:sulfur carrier protein
VSGVRVLVNGTAREVSDGATVDSLLAMLELPATGIAVAVDGEVRNRRTVLWDGASVEIVTAVQGG